MLKGVLLNREVRDQFLKWTSDSGEPRVARGLQAQSLIARSVLGEKQKALELLSIAPTATVLL